MSAGMARHGSVGAFSGFSVCQPALGASLQWLPAIGTAELDDMINAFLPGPASIQDKRAHISMDFFEYYRQTGENFKFYPVAAGSFTPATASPATPALFDAAFAAPSFSNQSPVLSDQGSWTQSPAPRSSVSKKSSASSSSRQQQTAVDFASHPGMRILTKDGRDVTNSASRGCKTKEQRDHAHLMRIIKACDACRKKKTRCDPSHRKRVGSAAQAEPKPAKKPRKADESPPVAVVDAPTEFAVGDAFAPEALAFPSFETTYPEASFEEFWNDFTTLEQDPVAVAADFSFNDFVFDSFTNPQTFFSPSEGSSATSPSQVLTPSLVDASPLSASDLGVVDVAGDAVLQDMAVPYLTPGVAHGTNYVDFNLYSPGPEVYEDPVLQMRDLGSQHSSPQSSHSPGRASATASSSHISTHLPITASPAELEWCYDPAPSSDGHFVTNHNRLVEEGGTESRSPPDRQPTNHMRLDSYGDGDSGGGGGYSPDDSSSLPALGSQAPASTALESTRHSDIARHSYSTRNSHTASIVVADMELSSVSPSRSARPRRITTVAPPGVPQAPPATTTLATVSRSALQSSSHTALSRATPVVKSPAAGAPSRRFVGDVAPPGTLRYNRGCTGSAGSSTLSRQPLAGRARGPSSQGQSAPASTTPLLSTPPTRRIAGAQANGATTDLVAPFLLQLAVLGLVSLLCAAVRAAHHPAPVVGQAATLANVVLALASLSLSRASSSSKSSTRGPAGLLPGAIQSWAASVLHLPLPAESLDGDVRCHGVHVKSKIQPPASLDFGSGAAQWARGLRPVRMLGLS
ncbi:hypothetical protein C8A05DRAFT_38965 [Staphylotrichum tortipilum]|uniref:Uncharacterized protein n=1 Tax=Staphylotrichum tortipilum TaxID=2831512 RepID=A0AAN6MAS5_9PEZI|nr:hypothetical protein C8A05DRAFT_38965 [Staphylotrichum longicolle]